MNRIQVLDDIETRRQSKQVKLKQIYQQGGSSHSPGYSQLTLGLCQLTPGYLFVYTLYFKEVDNFRCLQLVPGTAFSTAVEEH